MSVSDNSITRIIRAALNMQDTVAKRISESKKVAGEGRTGKLVIDDPGDGATPGPNHTVLYFRVNNMHLTLLEEKPETVRNEIIFLGSPENNYTGVDLFTDGLYNKDLYRKAYTEGWLIVTDPDRSFLAEYDVEEMIQICEDLIGRVAKTVNT
jgi:hypothetical protein